MILMFYMFPAIFVHESKPGRYIPVIEMINIPPTRQNLERRPPPARPVIPVPVDQVEFLDQVRVELEPSDQLSDSLLQADFISGLPRGYKPRQILEVVPQNINNMSLYKSHARLSCAVGIMATEHNYIYFNTFKY